MAVSGSSNDLLHVVALLGAGVVVVPVFKRLGLGSVLGYLFAGLIIGPFGLGLFSNPEAILHVAELGVVMFLFVIGLEMQPSRLWHLRRDIFGLGAVQVTLCGTALTGAGLLAGLSLPVAFVAGMGFVLSSTAIVMQLLEERGETSSIKGQRLVSTLLLEDLAIVPLLAIVAFLAPGSEGNGGISWYALATAIACIAALLTVGIWLLNPIFAILAGSHAREVMTAAALFVVLGAALLMEFGGLSMAMGSFLAGVLLSESSFRRQLEVDIEPFRGILLGLFFMAVGMSLDLAIVALHWPLIAAGVVVCMTLKSTGVYFAARIFGSSHREGLYRGALLAQGGEFAFVLYAAATTAGIFNVTTNAILSAIVILSMALTPFTVMALRLLASTRKEVNLMDVEEPDGLTGTVLMIGFGRFGQIVSQSLLGRGFDVSIIESDAKRIRSAANFGFKVYYGDGTRLDVLKASGSDQAAAVLVCVAGVDVTNSIVEMVKSEFPSTKIFARAFDRGHALHLAKIGVDYQIRETFESAIVFGEEALLGLGVPAEEATEITADIRHRDQERLELQMTAGLYAGQDLMIGNMPTPTPLIKPRREGQIFDESVQGAEREAQQASEAGR